jgi:hypothetical protein
MSRDPWPDVLHLWDVVWTKHGDVWEGPPTSDPTPSLPLALELGRIEVRADRYVMTDPGRTLDRFGWADGEVGYHPAHPEEEEA